MIKNVTAKGVVFDFGGVISASPMASWNQTLYPYAEKVGLSRAAILAGFTKYRRYWDRGVWSFNDVYRHIFFDAGLPPPSDEILAGIWERDAMSWVAHLRLDTLNWMRELKAQGFKLGILSNMSPDFYEKLYVPACRAYRELVEVEVISGLVRLVKPDPLIYAWTARQMNLAPAELLFVDDTAANVEAARAGGWQAEVYPAAK